MGQVGELAQLGRVGADGVAVGHETADTGVEHDEGLVGGELVGGAAALAGVVGLGQQDGAAYPGGAGGGQAGAGQVVGHAVKAGIRPYAESGGRSWGIRLFGSVIFPEIFPDPPGLILIRGPPTDPVSVGALPPVMAGGSVGV